MSLALLGLFALPCRAQDRQRNLLPRLPVVTMEELTGGQIAAPNISPAPAPVAPVFGIPGVSFDFLTNIMSDATFTTARFAVGTGLVTKNGSVMNSLKADAYVKTNWMFSGEVQNSPSFINSLSLYAGYRKAAPNYELYLQGGGRRTFTTDSAATHPTFQGVGLLGAGWLPTTGGHLMLYGEGRLVTSPAGNIWNTGPQGEAVVGGKFLF